MHISGANMTHLSREGKFVHPRFSAVLIPGPFRRKPSSNQAPEVQVFPRRSTTLRVESGEGLSIASPALPNQRAAMERPYSGRPSAGRVEDPYRGTRVAGCLFLTSPRPGSVPPATDAWVRTDH